MSLSKKNLYLSSLAVSLIGVFLLLTEDFGAWKDRDPFFGVVEGYIWIGSEKAFPFAQIGIIALTVCLLYVAYTSYKGYSSVEGEVNSLLDNGFKVVKAEIGFTVISSLGFILLTLDSDWWWFGTGFYAALIAGLVNYWAYRQLV